MGTKTDSRHRAERIRRPLGEFLSATLPDNDEIFSVQCKACGLAVRLLLNPDTEVCFHVTRSCLSIAAWMVVDLPCTPDEALELVTAIGPRRMPRFTIVD